MVKEKGDLMIVGNFTPDPIEWMHIGISGVIGPGETDDMDESRARHILNKFAARGLVQMKYGDDENVKKKESMALWTVFWERQVEQFNNHNEDQKEKGNRYTRPDDKMVEMAKMLDLEILQPWRVIAKDDAQIKLLRDENVALKETVAEQTGQIKQILEMLKAGKTPGADPGSESAPEPSNGEVAANRKKYGSLTAKTMPGWLKNNWDEVQEMPEENRFEIQTRYEELLQTPFPAEKPT